MQYRNKIWDNPISIMIDKTQLETLIKELPQYATSDWKHISGLTFEYCGTIKARVSIPYNDNSWRNTYLAFGNSSTVHPVDKEFLTNAERQLVLKNFLTDVLEQYRIEHPDIKIICDNR